MGVEVKKRTTLIEEGLSSLTKIVLKNTAVMGPAARKYFKCLYVLPCASQHHNMMEADPAVSER